MTNQTGTSIAELPGLWWR